MKKQIVAFGIGILAALGFMGILSFNQKNLKNDTNRFLYQTENSRYLMFNCLNVISLSEELQGLEFVAKGAKIEKSAKENEIYVFPNAPIVELEFTKMNGEKVNLQFNTLKIPKPDILFL